MTDDMRLTAALIRAEWDAFLALLGSASRDGAADLRRPGVDGEPWDRSTRLAGWAVEDLARHVHWGVTLETDGLRLARRAGTGLGPDPGRGTVADGGRATDSDVATRAEGRPLDGDRAEILPALQTAVRGLAAELEAVVPDEGRTVPMPYGDIPLGLALDVFLMEAAMHRSDLSHALTGDSSVTPAALPTCARVFQTFWPAFAETATARPVPGTALRLAGTGVGVEAQWDGSAWGGVTRVPTVEVTGPDESVVLFAYGRVPLDDAGLTVTGDRSLAVAFKDLVPGP